MFKAREKAGIFGERIDDFIVAFNDGLRNQQLIRNNDTGRVEARFYNCSLSSVFQPVVHASSERVVGHHGFLRASGADGDALSPWGVFSFAVADDELVDLDRLCRTLHVLNYYRTASRNDTLYLNVQLRLLQTVGRDFGRAFELRLERLGLRPGQIAIVLPPDVIAHPELLRAALADYQERGYRVVAAYPGNPAQWPDSGTLKPDVLKIDARDFSDAAAWSNAARAIRALGALALAENVETPEQLGRAQDAGFDLLQGHAFGYPLADICPALPAGAGQAALAGLALW